MPYLGNELATQFQAFVTQTITGDGSTGYTLDRAVANGKELLVYINNVKQEEGSGKAYTASGTTITFSDAVASTDSCYVVFLGSAVQTVVPPDGSVSSAKLDTNIAVSGDLTVDTDTLKVDSSNDIVLINTTTEGRASEGADILTIEAADDGHAGMTIRSGTSSYGTIYFSDGTSGAAEYAGNIQFNHDTNILALGAAGIDALKIDSSGHITKPSQPAFHVINGADNGNIATNNTEITVNFSTESFDVNSDFNTTNFTFTAPVTGKYQFNVSLSVSQIDTAATQYLIRLNTSNRNYHLAIDPEFGSDTLFPFSISALADMDASDTAIVTISQDGGTAQTDVRADPGSHFSGFLAC